MVTSQNKKNTKLPLTGPLLIAVAASLWAVDGVIRRSLYVLLPIVIVFYEHFIGSALISVIARKSLGKIQFTKKVVGLTLLVSFLSGLLGTLWFTSALVKINFISFSVVLLLQKLQPIFAVLMARIFLKEKISSSYLLWASLALIAAYFVTFPGGKVNLATGSETFHAALLAVGAAAAWGSSTAFSKLLLQETKHQQATALRFFTTTIMALVAIVWGGQLSLLMQINGSQLLRFGFIAISTGMVALLIYYKGLQKTPAQISTILELIFPVLAVFIDMVVYKTFLNPSQYLAAGILLAAMYQVSRRRLAS